METYKNSKFLVLVTVIVMNITIIVSFLLIKINYVPKEELESMELKVDSLQSVQLNNDKLSEKMLPADNNVEMKKLKEMKKNLIELQKHILAYQSQLKSLIAENERLEIKLHSLEASNK